MYSEEEAIVTHEFLGFAKASGPSTNCFKTKELLQEEKSRRKMPAADNRVATIQIMREFVLTICMHQHDEVLKK